MKAILARISTPMKNLLSSSLTNLADNSILKTLILQTFAVVVEEDNLKDLKLTQ